MHKQEILPADLIPSDQPTHHRMLAAAVPVTGASVRAAEGRREGGANTVLHTSPWTSERCAGVSLLKEPFAEPFFLSARSKCNPDS